MVADIVGGNGNKAELTREQMIYCLFRHTAAQAVRDLVARTASGLFEREIEITPEPDPVPHPPSQ